MSLDLRNVSLNLEIEDLETQQKPCCDSSTTSPLCTCPIRLTDCCDMLEYTDQQ